MMWSILCLPSLPRKFPSALFRLGHLWSSVTENFPCRNGDFFKYMTTKSACQPLHYHGSQRVQRNTWCVFLALSLESQSLCMVFSDISHLTRVCYTNLASLVVIFTVYFVSLKVMPSWVFKVVIPSLLVHFLLNLAQKEFRGRSLRGQNVGRTLCLDLLTSVC